MSVIILTMAYVQHSLNSNGILMKYLMKSMLIFLSLPPRVTCPPNMKKRWIFGAAFMIVSGLVTAYRIYKSYTFRKNVQHTLSYILSNQRHYQQNVLSNKKYLLSLAEITSSNFKDVCTDIANLKTETNKFDRYLHKLIHTTADTIFYKNYILHYVNILHHLDHAIVTNNNKIKHIKSTLHMKCRNFISGLHILARNRIPESILHADVFSNILHGVSQYLRKDNVYTLLYGTSVNPYYGMEVVKSFILNGALFMTISLPLKHHRAPILSLCGLFSYHLPINMSDEKSLSSSYTKLQVSHPYLLLGDDQYALLDNNFDRQVVQYDHMYVQQEPLLLFRRTDKNCYINIIEHAPAKTITSTCMFHYYHKITVHSSLVTTSHFFYILNINDELKITCGKYGGQTTHHSHSVSIIKRTNACEPVEIQLIGSHSNCSSNGNFIIYHTFNFVTEWLHNKVVIPYFRENKHLLRLPSNASIPNFTIIKSNQ